MRSKLQLKRKLKQIGIEVIGGNFVKRSQLTKAVTAAEDPVWTENQRLRKLVASKVKGISKIEDGPHGITGFYVNFPNTKIQVNLGYANDHSFVYDTYQIKDGATVGGDRKLKTDTAVVDSIKAILTSVAKASVKKDLKDLGFEIIKGNYVKKSQISKVIAAFEEDEELSIPEHVKGEIKKYLKTLVEERKKDIKSSPDDYKDTGSDDPAIDVRLQWHDGKWSVLTGDSSYDQDHRGYWGTSSITLDTKSEELANDLIDQVEEHLASDNARGSISAAVGLELGPVDAAAWEAFADRYRDTYKDIDSYVVPAGEGKVKLTPKLTKELKRTYKVFTDGKATDKDEKENLAMAKEVVNKVIKEVCDEVGISPKKVTYKISLGDGDKVVIRYAGETLDLDGLYYYTDEDAREGVSDSFKSWEWLALLGDETSPFFSYSFLDGYVETQAAQARGELISYNDHTQMDWERDLKKFLIYNKD